LNEINGDGEQATMAAIIIN